MAPVAVRSYQFLYQLGPEGTRKVLDDIQAVPIDMPRVDEKWITVPADVGDIQVRIVKPVGSDGPLPRSSTSTAVAGSSATPAPRHWREAYSADDEEA